MHRRAANATAAAINTANGIPIPIPSACGTEYSLVGLDVDVGNAADVL